MNLLLKTIGVLWASPNTIFSFIIGLFGVLFGGRIRFVKGALEFHGGLVTWILSRFPRKVSAMTLGHTVWGLDPEALEITREHEHVHIAQYERWGPFFIPAYLLCSLYMKYKGKDAYYDNPFEVEAYTKSPNPPGRTKESDD